jgi:APA family basic amino acid/polyamine antiporter
MPLLGIVCCLGQMLVLPSITWLQLLIWLALGLAIYFLYGIKHSKIRRTHTGIDN